VAWVLTELSRRLDMFMFHPERVLDVVPWALPPFFSNADEQTLMNDVVVSAVMGTPYYVGSTATFEVRGRNMNKEIKWWRREDHSHFRGEGKNMNKTILCWRRRDHSHIRCVRGMTTTKNQILEETLAGEWRRRPANAHQRRHRTTHTLRSQPFCISQAKGLETSTW
jgi:hypothetical protein